MLDDAAYIRQFLEQGSQRALQALVEKYQGRVYTLCLKVIKDKEVAEEVAQDVFVKAFKELGQLKDRHKFPNWLLKIAYSKSIDQIRKKSIVKKAINEVDSPLLIEKKTPLDTTVINDRKQLLRHAIGRLPNEDASIITLYYLEEMNIKEIAEIVGISTSNVKVKLFRARKSLRTIFDFINEKRLERLNLNLYE